MEKLINITEENGQQVVSARELYDYLEINERFSRWFERMVTYGLYKEIDYTPYQNVHPLNNQEILDYALTLDCAKEVSMIQRNEKGKKARKYFIEVEKKAKEMASANNSINFNDPNQVLQLAKNWATEFNLRVKAEKKVAVLKPKADLMDRVLDTGQKIDIGQASKILELPFGRNKLFKALREQGIFFKNRNEPKQQYINKGFFSLKEQFIDKKGGFINIKVLVTQKGLEFLSKMFDSKGSDNQLALIS